MPKNLYKLYKNLIKIDSYQSEFVIEQEQEIEMNTLTIKNINALISSNNWCGINIELEMNYTE